MSVAAMTWAWKQPLEPTDKFILIALSDHANDEDYTCWPSLNHLQRKTGFSRPTIWKAIDRLVELKALERVGESSAGSTKYKVLVGNLVTYGNEITQVTRLPMVGNDVNQVGNQVNTVGNDVTPNHQEPSEPSLNHQAEASSVVFITLTLNTGEEFPIHENQCAEWGTLFPAVNVPQELRAMRAWLLANPRNRKTRSGVLRFVTSWLTRSQNSARTIGAGHATRERIDNTAPARVRRANGIVR